MVPKQAQRVVVFWSVWKIPRRLKTSLFYLFMNVAPLTEAALIVVKSGRERFMRPSSFVFVAAEERLRCLRGQVFLRLSALKIQPFVALPLSVKDWIQMSKVKVSEGASSPADISLYG